MRARYGYHTFPLAKFPIRFEAPMIGVVTAGVTVGFFLAAWLTMLVCIPLCWSVPRELLWYLCWSYRNAVIGILIPALVTPLLTFVLRNVIFVDAASVRSRILLS